LRARLTRVRFRGRGAFVPALCSLLNGRRSGTESQTSLAYYEFRIDVAVDRNLRTAAEWTGPQRWYRNRESAQWIDSCAVVRLPGHLNAVLFKAASASSALILERPTLRRRPLLWIVAALRRLPCSDPAVRARYGADGQPPDAIQDRGAKNERPDKPQSQRGRRDVAQKHANAAIAHALLHLIGSQFAIRNVVAKSRPAAYSSISRSSFSRSAMSSIIRRWVSGSVAIWRASLR
jgi:hypothetical protein